MSAIDAQTILNLTAALAQTYASDYARRFDLSTLDDTTRQTIAQQLVPGLVPGIVAFTARLSASVPSDIDLAAVLARFLADPATTAALARYGADRDDGLRAVAEALVAAGLPSDLVDEKALGEALLAWVAASIEVARLQPPTNYQQAAQFVSQQPPPAGIPTSLREMMESLVYWLAREGLSHIEDGEIIATDGRTLLAAWRRGQSALRDEPTSGAEPPAAPPTPDEFIDLAPPILEIATAEPPMPPLLNGEPGVLEEMVDLTAPIMEIAEVDPPPPLPPTTPPSSEPPPTPATTSEPPATAEVVNLRLDAAAPPRVDVGVPFDLAVAIRQAASPPLAIGGLTQQESAGFAAIMPAGALYVSLRIQVAAPGCEIHGGDTRPVRVLRGQDGPPVYFHLTPRRAGPLSVIVTVYQEADWIGSARLLSEAGMGVESAGVGDAAAVAMAAPVGPRAGLTLNVQSAPLGETEVNLKTLRDALDHGYNDGELRDLCFELEVDFEDLPGDGQAAKARELVLFCKRRGLLATLVGLVMRDRPHLLVN